MCSETRLLAERIVDQIEELHGDLHEVARRVDAQHGLAQEELVDIGRRASSIVDTLFEHPEGVADIAQVNLDLRDRRTGADLLARRGEAEHRRDLLVGLEQAVHQRGVELLLGLQQRRLRAQEVSGGSGEGLDGRGSEF